MTGPGPGKIRLRASVVLELNGRSLTFRGSSDVDVYLHVKGWSRAPVTHIDIEREGIEELILGGPGRGVYGIVKPLNFGFRFVPFRARFVITVMGPEDPILSKVFTGSLPPYPGYLGAKRGGVYVGFKKSIILLLEKAALELYGIAPRKRKQGL